MLSNHCSNLFDLRMVWLDISTFLHSKCVHDDFDCKSIQNVTVNSSDSSQPSLVYVLDVIHCYLVCSLSLFFCVISHQNILSETVLSISMQYHGYSDDDNSTVQRLRDYIIDKNDGILEYHKSTQLLSSSAQSPMSPMKLTVGGDGKHRHGSATSFTSNQSTVTNTTNTTNITLSSLSGDDGHRSDTDPDVVPQLPVTVKGKHPKIPRVHSIEMSEDRVRKLSGQIDPNHIKELIAEYDDDRKMGLEDVESDGLISPSDEPSSTMDDRERAEIETFKLKLDNLDAKEDGDSENENAEMRERKGSKHNLMRAQQGDEWDADTMNQTVEDMKKHLFHLALQTSSNGLQ